VAMPMNVGCIRRELGTEVCWGGVVVCERRVLVLWAADRLAHDRPVGGTLRRMSAYSPSWM
jgi:hypothetical protein